MASLVPLCDTWEVVSLDVGDASGHGCEVCLTSGILDQVKQLVMSVGLHLFGVRSLQWKVGHENLVRGPKEETWSALATYKHQENENIWNLDPEMPVERLLGVRRLLDPGMPDGKIVGCQIRGSSLDPEIPV